MTSKSPQSNTLKKGPLKFQKWPFFNIFTPAHAIPIQTQVLKFSQIHHTLGNKMSPHSTPQSPWSKKSFVKSYPTGNKLNNRCFHSGPHPLVFVIEALCFIIGGRCSSLAHVQRVKNMKLHSKRVYNVPWSASAQESAWLRDKSKRISACYEVE